MSNIIESLTDKQQAELLEWRKRYFNIGWSAKPADRPAAEAAMTALYKRMNLGQPKFVWFDSPAEAVRCIRESTGKATTLTGVDGQLDAYWVAFYDFCRHIGGNVSDGDSTHLDEWRSLVESTGPCWPYEKYCLMSERPCVASYDDRGQLHSDDGPALAYRDGFEIYAVHGIRVPKNVVMAPWTMTLRDIESSDVNEDVRTIMQDLWCHEKVDSTGRRFGSGGGRWLEETGAKTLDLDVYTAYTDEDTGESVQLQRALIQDKHNRKFLMCSDSSTDRVYYIQVAPESTTCCEAHMSVNGGVPDGKITVSA